MLHGTNVKITSCHVKWWPYVTKK